MRMTLDDNTEKQIDAICAYAKAALQEEYVDKPNYIHYLDAFVRVFADKLSKFDEKTEHAVREIAELIFTSYDLTSSEEPQKNDEQLLALKNSIKELLKNTIAEPDYLADKNWSVQFISNILSEPALAADNTIVSIEAAIQEIETELDALMAEYSDLARSNTPIFSGDDDDEDETLDVADLQRELNTVAVPNIAAEQLEQFKQAFYQLIADFQTNASQHNSQHAAIDEIVTGIVNNLIVLALPYFESTLTVDALDKLDEGHQGVLFSWSRLCSMKSKTEGNSLLKGLLVPLQQLEKELSQLTQTVKDQLNTQKSHKC
jgi:hypothetical protein